MCYVVSIFGMLVAAVFAVLVYGPLGYDVYQEIPWFDTIFWGLIIAANLPAAAIAARMLLRAFGTRARLMGSMGRPFVGQN